MLPEESKTVAVKGKEGLSQLYDENDAYQFHGYVKKKNRWTFYDNRFIVLTLKWMINVDAGFSDDKCLSINFKKLLWRAPLAALRQVEIEQSKDGVIVKMKFDVLKQTEILKEAGYPFDKKAKIKEKRKLLFVDAGACATFVYQLKRLSHLHTNSAVAQYI